MTKFNKCEKKLTGTTILQLAHDSRSSSRVWGRYLIYGPSLRRVGCGHERLTRHSSRFKQADVRKWTHCPLILALPLCGKSFRLFAKHWHVLADGVGTQH